MEDFEQQLKNALARKYAPDRFEAKVMAAARQTSAAPRLHLFRRWRWASSLAATVLVIGGISWQVERTMHERAEGKAAKARLELALKITRTKLAKIEQKLNEAERDNN